MQVEVSGWFESERGAEQFFVVGRNVEFAARQFVADYGDAAVGVDREADVGRDDGVALNGEFRFWRAVDMAAA